MRTSVISVLFLVERLCTCIFLIILHINWGAKFLRHLKVSNTFLKWRRSLMESHIKHFNHLTICVVQWRPLIVCRILLARYRHLHDDVILLLRPESFSFFFPYSNLLIPVRFQWQKPKFAQESKPEKDSGARFSKVPVTLRTRNQIFKSKYQEQERGSWQANYSILFH